MKKLMILFAALVLSLSFAGCAMVEEEPQNPTENTQSVATDTEETPEEVLTETQE